ncbi:MAG: pantetheine-phosphate adenylyltransferase [Candidatus Marinimicrobia bacterium]|nr:pantetheine-phosphate adenylyltransferase [Candidatus Neomarinimicrobiota bacterium]
MKIAIYPGTFDPITNGHLDVIERASSLFDKVIVAVLKKTDNKKVLFNEEDRLSMVSKSIQKFSNVEVDIFDGLLIKYAELKDASAVIRGLRAISDFEYEFQMALMNRNLNEKVRTLFLMPHQKYIHISSSLVKEVAQLKGDISQYVPEHVNQLLKDKYN